MSRSFELPEAEWATVGAVGEPGHRTFYLQARQESQLVTLKLEKQHVAAIAQFLSEILSDLPAPEQEGDDAGAALVEPVLAEWPVGSLQLAYDSTSDRVVILAEEMGEGDEEDEAGEGEPEDGFDRDRGAARLGLTRASAALIVRVGAELISAGRPLCTLCGRPMDPEGHSCPRTNGHKPN
ncbi:MAG TPA: DUF3090 family protein [Acidimicrobiales bacterium]|nr:DUF3090 family protein [Acidimicrobiales bacterium]